MRAVHHFRINETEGIAGPNSAAIHTPAPVALITEYPDETIDGDALIAGTTAQAAAVVAAYEAWQDCIPQPFSAGKEV